MCAPEDNDLTSTSTSLWTGPRLTAMRFSLQQESSALRSVSSNTNIRCAVCHIRERTAVVSLYSLQYLTALEIDSI